VGARHGRVRSRRAILLPVLVLALTTLGASGAVVWLAADVLPRAGADAPPMADVVELAKVGLSVGLSHLVDPG
jgi:hypothetical protein